jgi:hypothetical protein
MPRTPAKCAKKSAPVKRAARVERVPSEIEKLQKSLEDMAVTTLRKVVECATALVHLADYRHTGIHV